MPGAGFIDYESNEHFAPLTCKLAMAAAEEMLRERDLFPTVDAPAAVLKKSQGDHDRPNLLESMDTGIALGLVGDATAAREMFALYVERRGLQRGRDDWRSFT